MAQNITFLGASYSDVPAVELPKTGGGTAKFADPSGVTAEASDVTSGKLFLSSTGELLEGTASGGSSAIVVIDEQLPSGGIAKHITGVDISNDTVDAAHLAQGYTAHDSTGTAITGTMNPSWFNYDDLVNATRYSGAGSLGMVKRPAFTGVVNLTGTTLFPFAFTGMDITEVHGPDVTGIIAWNLGGGNNDSGVFASCALLEVVDLPKLTKVVGNMFEDCLSLRSVNLPSVTSPLYYSTFNDCKSLEQIALPKMSGNVDRTFGGCSKLKRVDLNNPTNFSINVFQNNTVLEDLIIRRTAGITTLANISAFSGTPFASGGTGGTIYIPKALYDHLGDGTSLDYKAATNWSTIDGYGTITWAQIEGSIYETQYADGTLIKRWLLGYGVYVNNNVIEYINTSTARATFIVGQGDNHIPVYQDSTATNYYAIELPENATRIVATVTAGSDIYYKLYALAYDDVSGKWQQLAGVGWSQTDPLVVPSGATHWMAAIKKGSAGTDTVTISDTENITFDIET